MEKLYIKISKLSFFKKSLLAFMAGGLTALAFPGLYMVWVLWLTFPFVLILQDSLNSKKKSFYIGFYFGAGLFVASMYWLYYPLTLMNGQFLWLIPFAMIGVMIWGGIFCGACFYLISFFDGKLLKITAFAVFWSCLEYVRSNFIFGGIAWNSFATVWAGYVQIAQIASVIGSYNLTLLTIFIVSLPFGLQKKYYITSLILFLSLFSFGEYRMNKYPTEFGEKNFKIIQPNISQEKKHSMESRAEVLDTLVKMSNEKEKADYIIWSETAFPYIWKSGKGESSLNLPIESDIITGIMRVEGNRDDFEVFNSVIITKSEKIDFIYDKIHLVPFGEYIPLGKYIPMQKIVPGQKDISSGINNDYYYDPSIGNIAISICYEIIFSGALKYKENKDVDIMINITNDKWFGDTHAPHQHLANAVIRAIEEGVPVVRAANSGISAVIDPVGRIIKKTDVESVDTLVSMFPKKLEKNTIFYKNGNKLVLILLGFVLIVILIRNKK